MDTITEQDRWLDTLQSLSKRPVQVSRNVNGKPTKWVSLTDCELPVDYRTILHNEIVIDIDSEHWKKVRMFAEIITDTLVKLGIPYITAYSGGRGVHIHVFFDLSRDQKKVSDKTDVMPRDLRVWLFEYILKNAEISPALIGPGKPFDTSCVNWSDEGKGHLIRVFGGKKKWCKVLLSEIPEERPHKDEIRFPGDIELWNIPEQLFQEFVNWFRRFEKERVEAIVRYRKASQNFSGLYLNLPCVQKILGGLPEGQRNAGARIIAIGSRLSNLTREETQKVVFTYAGNCSQQNISESEYQGWIDWIYSEEDPFWNCRFCRELDICNPSSCTLHESAFAKEHEFLSSKTLMQDISRVLDKKIKKEEKNKLIVLFVYASAYGSNPLNLFLKGESSVGKTYLAKSVAEYFPPEDVWFIGDMSPKALIHEHGQYENGKVYVSLENKILVFLESPRRETLEMLKPILSHDRKEIEYKIADKNSAGRLQTKNVIIQGWPATVFCTTDFRVLEELSTRSLLTTPESTQEKIEKVLEYKGLKYARPWEEITDDEDEEVFKNALKLLRSRVEVCIPYAAELAQRYTTTEARVMRDFDKCMELIKMSAFLHQMQRPSFELEFNGGQKFVIATEDDYIVGSDLFDHIERTTVTGLSQNVIEFYEKVVCELGVLTYATMMKKYKDVYGKLIGRDKLRRKYVDPLETVGWMDREKDPEDGRRWIFEKCHENAELQKIRNCAHLVFRDMFPEDRIKEYVESVEKICAQHGCSKIVCGGEVLGSGDCGWFYSDSDCAYFSEEEGGIDIKIKEENDCKSEQRTNAHNSGEENSGCRVLEDNLINQYDEETVLLQIPQEDTRIEDVVKKFKDQNKVVDTLVVLEEKKKIIVGQGYMRRIQDSPRTSNPDDTCISGLNK